MSQSSSRLHLDADAVRQRLSMQQCIEAMKLGLGDDIEAPHRVKVGSQLFMPGRAGAFTGVKVICIVPGNPAGIVLVFHADGSFAGSLDGPTITALRTGAAAGLGTHLLAPQKVSTLAMLGTGFIAFDQIQAVLTVRPSITRVCLWGMEKDKALHMQNRLQSLHPTLDVVCSASANEAVSQAHIVSCATPSRAPLFDPSCIQPGTHINAVGAYTPEMVEIPKEVVQKARVFVEDLEAARVEAGDLLQAERQPDGTVADLLFNRVQGRVSAEDITFYKGVGVASMDVAAGAAALGLLNS
jgi:alanine dehydrogenase